MLILNPPSVYDLEIKRNVNLIPDVCYLEVYARCLRKAVHVFASTVRRVSPSLQSEFRENNSAAAAFTRGGSVFRSVRFDRFAHGTHSDAFRSFLARKTPVGSVQIPAVSPFLMR